MSTSTDRTQEFLRFATTLPPPPNPTPSSLSSSSASSSHRGGTSSADNSSHGRTRKSNAVLRNFHGTASEISRDIAGTSQLLTELTRLVRRRGLFTEESDNAKVNELTVMIKENVQSLNSRLDEAAGIIANEKNKARKGSQPVQEASNLVGKLQEEFALTTSGFKDVLQQRSDRMKENNDWKSQIHGSTSSSGGAFERKKLQLGMPKNSNVITGGFQPLSLMQTPAGEETSQISLPRPHGVSGGGGMYSTPTSTLTNRFKNSDSRNTMQALTPIDIQRMDEESGNEQMMQLIPNQTYLQDRADQMSQVESNIVELGTIFNKLAVMVNEHKEMVHRIEDNAEEANVAIQDSLYQLTNTLESLRTNRMLMMKISGVLILFVIIFVTFFA